MDGEGLGPFGHLPITELEVRGPAVPQQIPLNEQMTESVSVARQRVRKLVATPQVCLSHFKAAVIFVFCNGSCLAGATTPSFSPRETRLLPTEAPGQLLSVTGAGRLELSRVAAGS